MAQAMVNYYNTYNERIQFLRLQGDQLMQRIQMLEIGMNRRKQQNQQPHDNEVVSLHSMVKKLLQMLAEINTCQYFQLINKLYNPNDYYYKQMCTRYFQDFLLQFNLKLKARREKRNLNYDVDFMITSAHI